MDKSEERVWCTPTCKLNGLSELSGVSSSAKDWAFFARDVLPGARFMRRGDVEDDPTTKQIIPYVLVRHEDKILVYNRGAKGGEERLADMFSVGVGGHINPPDAQDLPDSSPVEVIMKAANRELREELTGSKELPLHEIKYVGLLNIDATPVDQVHMGVVLEAWFSSIEELTGSDEVDAPQWVTIEQLGNCPLESWSEIIYEEVLLREKNQTRKESNET